MRHRDLSPANGVRWTAGALWLIGSTAALVLLFLWLVFA